MSTPFIIARDINGYPTTGNYSCHRPSDTGYQVILTANTVATVTVPASSNSSQVIAKFTYAIATGNPVVWARPNNASALVLATTTATATVDELNPDCWQLSSGQVIQLLTAQTGVNVSIMYYSLASNG